MCTAVTYRTTDHYFGRNLDLEYGYQERVTVTPRNYPFPMRKVADLILHYAMIGMATVVDGYPLYYEATNEKGLSMAGLNFPGLAHYFPVQSGKDNITPFEFIPWILGRCANIQEAKATLVQLNLVNISFSEELPLSPLHWIIADRERAITVESTPQGLKLYDNPIGVLTNNPPFDYHLYNLRNYMNLSPFPAENRFSADYELTQYSNGMGGIGLPGDLSSASRFVRAAFVKLNSVSGDSEGENVGQFFHILDSVAMPRGSVRVGEKHDITRYSCCCNTDKGIYYYTTYGNRQIRAVDMHRIDLNGRIPISYELIDDQQFHFQN